MIHLYTSSCQTLPCTNSCDHKSATLLSIFFLHVPNKQPAPGEKANTHHGSSHIPKQRNSAFMILKECHILAAREQRFDIVLIDTAGRMQDNEPLMRSLSKVQ
jgi:hypothetical protein